MNGGAFGSPNYNVPTKSQYKMTGCLSQAKFFEETRVDKKLFIKYLPGA